MKDEVERWFKQAADDYDTADLLLKQGKYSACAFHCHQAAERYPDAFEAVIPAEYYTVEMAEEAVEWAQVVLQFVRQHLP